MNFHSSQTGILNEVANVPLLQPQDLNTLVSGLKSREENLIELLDRNLKYKASKTVRELTKLQTLQVQYQANENERERKENELIKKYSGSKIYDEKQKKLVQKLCKRVFELNEQVRSKLEELCIFEQTKDHWETSKIYEMELRTYVNSIPIDLNIVFICITTNSRNRFSSTIEIVKGTDKIPRKTPRRTFESNLLFNNQNKYGNVNGYENNALNFLENFQTIERRLSLDNEEKNQKYEGSRNETLNHEGERRLRDRSSPFIVSMNIVRSESSFSYLFNNHPDMGPRMSTDMSHNIGAIDRIYLKNDINEEMAHIKEVKALKEKLNNTKNLGQIRKMKSKSKSELVKIDLNANISPSNLPFINQNTKKTGQNKKNKQIAEEDKDLLQKEAIPKYLYVDLTKNDFLKNYDILRAEPSNITFMPKKSEGRKAVLEKVFVDLISMNQNAKRAINNYNAEYQHYALRRHPHSFIKKTILLEKPVIKAKPPTTSSTPQVEISKSPMVFSIRNARQGELSVKRKGEIETKVEKSIHQTPVKVQNSITPQRLLSMQEPLLQRDSKELRSLTKLDSSLIRNESPFKMIESEEKGRMILDKNHKSTSLKDLSPKHKQARKQFMDRYFHENLLKIESLNQYKQGTIKLQSTNQSDPNKLQYEILGTLNNHHSGLNSTQTSDSKTKIGSNSQSMNSLVAKINQEQYLNQQLLNKRIY